MSTGIAVWPASWSQTGQFVLLTIVGYILLAIILRATHKHTLAQTSPFSLILLVTFGSIFGAAIAQGKISFVDGMVIVVILILMETLTNWLLLRHPKWRSYLESPPALLFADGQFIWETMLREHVTEKDIRAEARHAGFDDLSLIKAIYLESNGDYSIIPKTTPAEPLRTEARSLG